MNRGYYYIAVYCLKKKKKTKGGRDQKELLELNEIMKKKLSIMNWHNGIWCIENLIKFKNNITLNIITLKQKIRNICIYF